MNTRPLRMLNTTFLGALLILCAGCGTADHSASFVDIRSGVKIAIELDAAHPYLAEYDRILIISKGHQFEHQYRLSMDTGGYAAANLYSCSNTTFVLDSYSEFVVIDTATSVIRSGKCNGTPIYVGAFDGGGSKPWLFFSASQRPEVKLEMHGG